MSQNWRRWLAERSSRCRVAFDPYRLRFEMVLKPPAQIEALAELQRRSGTLMDSGYAEFLSQINGFTLSINARYQGDEMFVDPLVVLGVEEIEPAVAALERVQGAGKLSGYLPFADYGSGADYCLFAQSEATPFVVDGFHEYRAATWRTEARIASSFSEWIDSVFSAMSEHLERPAYWTHEPLVH